MEPTPRGEVSVLTSSFVSSRDSPSLILLGMRYRSVLELLKTCSCPCSDSFPLSSRATTANA